MIERYIIKELVFQGYWSEEHHDFKGIIFASQYETLRQAQDEIENHISAGTYAIIKIYRK